MGTLLTLSKSASVTCSWIAIICAVGFGTLFLLSWCVEEFAESEKWKRRRKLLITLAIIGALGEQIATVAEFVLSEHLQTISDSELAEHTTPRRLNTQQQAAIAASLKPLSLMPDPKGIPEQADVIVFPLTAEAAALSDQIVATLKAATWNADLGQEHGVFFGVAISGVAVFVHGLDSPKAKACATKLTEELKANGILARFAGPVPGWESCTELGMESRLETDPVCSALLVIVGDHP